jgi:CheY-like chemotaxis protein
MFAVQMIPNTIDLSSFDILVTEDNFFLRKLICEILTSFGVGTIRQATSGVEALAEVEKRKPDIIISDWVMPGSGGLSLLRALRSDNNGRFPHIPVIVLSGHATPDYVAQAMGEGADSYVVKPFSAKVLMEHLLKVIVREEDVYAI